MIPVFDGHNDFLLRLYEHPAQREALWLTGGKEGHLDLPRMKTGRFAGGFFAIYIPSPIAHDAPDYMEAMENPPFSLPLADLIDHHTAQPIALAKAGHLMWMERVSNGAFKICTTAAELRDCLSKGVISAILHNFSLINLTGCGSNSPHHRRENGRSPVPFPKLIYEN